MITDNKTTKPKYWNHKVIETSNQWNYNAEGSAEAKSAGYSLEGIMEIARYTLSNEYEY